MWKPREQSPQPPVSWMWKSREQPPNRLPPNCGSHINSFLKVLAPELPGYDGLWIKANIFFVTLICGNLLSHLGKATYKLQRGITQSSCQFEGQTYKTTLERLHFDILKNSASMWKLISLKYSYPRLEDTEMSDLLWPLEQAKGDSFCFLSQRDSKATLKF